jgi:two-component system, NarL family, response regulator LiaR
LETVISGEEDGEVTVKSSAPGPESTTGLRVAIINDYEVIVAGVRGMLLPYRDRVDVVELDVGDTPGQRVDVALFDTYGRPALDLDRIRSLATDELVGAVLVYTWAATTVIRTAALQAGAIEVIAKALSGAELAAAIEDVAAGRPVAAGLFGGEAQGAWPGSRWGLTSRESEALALLSTGMGNRAIAQAMFVSENTVRTHLKAVFKKLEVTTRSQAVARALADSGFVVERRGIGADTTSQ